MAAATWAEALLRSAEWMQGLAAMYGNSPRRWRPGLAHEERIRYTINALTRMRYCDADGGLELDCTVKPGLQPAGLVPWFDHPGRAHEDVHIVFGHWATLGVLQRSDITATDSGCVWGGSLTAVRLDPPGDVVSIACPGFRQP